MARKNKRKNLQPWLDYFRLLHTYQQQGHLEVKPQEHEAYVTLPALLTLSGYDEQTLAPALADGPRLLGAYADTLRRLRTYAAHLAAHQRGLQDYDPQTALDPSTPLPAIPKDELQGYLAQPFALHVVKPDPPHDLLYTLLLSRRPRSCKNLFRPGDSIEVISYDEEKVKEGDKK